MIKNIHLKNWRNWEDKKIDFNQNNIIFGLNGSGKTNILESIYYLANLSSWRLLSGFEQVKNFSSEYFELKAKIKSQNEDYDIGIFYGYVDHQKKRVIKLNQVKSSGKNINNIFKVILFSPEQIDLLTSPQGRRGYLNTFLSGFERNYKLSYINYSKVVYVKNKLLTQIREGLAHKSQLDFYNNELIKEAYSIVNYRRDWFGYLNENFSNQYFEFNHKKEKIRVEYRPKVVIEQLAEKIRTNTDKEILAGKTLYGPHKDDWMVVLNNSDIIYSASRGEWRSVLATLKLIETEYIKQKYFKPVIILDDVFSELDQDRRETLLHKWDAYQKIITTAEDAHILNIDKTWKVIKIDG